MLQRLADQALIGDSALFRAGFQRRDQGFGQAHGDAGGFGQGFEAHGFELREIEGREVLIQKVLGLRVRGQDGNGCRGRLGHNGDL